MAQHWPGALAQSRLEIIDQSHKRCNSFCCCATDACVGCAAQRQSKRNLLFVCVCIEPINSCVADAAFRHIQNSLQADFIERVSRATNVCKCIFDFTAVVEPRSTNHFVRHTSLHQTLFKNSALRVRSIKNSHLEPLSWLAIVHLL